MLDSLVRVSRRVAWNHYASILGENTVDLGPVTSYDAQSYNAPVREPHPLDLSPTDEADAGPTPDKCTGHEARMIVGGHGLMPNASLSTISRTVSLSFQSAFHLSITLLVCYRSLANI